MSQPALAALAVAAAAAALAAGAYAAPQDLALVSRAAGVDGAKANAPSSNPAVSADGRFVAFHSSATNLHPDDTDDTYDVFVRDQQADALTLVSRAAGATGEDANASATNPAISADGRFVAFYSESTNLHPDDTDGLRDVFVRDLKSDTLTLVSRAAGTTGAKGNGTSGLPAVSSDGRFVAFQSTATNLHPADTDDLFDVFVRDLQTNALTLVSRATGANGANGGGQALDPAISADGQLVAFHSTATNLHPDDTDGLADVFARDLQADTLTLVSRAAGATGVGADARAADAAVSADGRFVAFDSLATNLHPDDSDVTSDVFVRDLQADALTLVSRAAGATGTKANGTSALPTISSDGRFVAFESTATNLHPDDADEPSGVFARDLQAGTLTLISRAAGGAGATANDWSGQPAISADARVIAFRSLATNLHPDDTDGVLDVLAREVALAPPPPPPEPSPTPPLPVTPSPGPGECANGVDDDQDGWIDAADPQCASGRDQEGPPDNPVLTCAGAGLVLIDVLPAGRRVRIGGFANPALAGREVLVYAGGRRVARTRVRADGSYSTTAPRRSQRYQARTGDLRSRALKLNRRAVDATIAYRAGIVTLAGRVIAKRRRGARVELMVDRPGTCDSYSRVARKRLPRTGRFTISAPAPADRAVAVYRARIRLRGQTTYTLPRVIFLR